MSDTSIGRDDAISAEARALLARVEEADARATRSLRAALRELGIADDLRLEDRARAALSTFLNDCITAIAGELREFALRVLTGRSADEASATLSALSIDEVVTLATHLLTAEVAVVDECLARIRLELLAASLPIEAPAGTELPSLLAQLVRSPDRVVASAAADVLAGESARRDIRAAWGGPDTGLPTPLQAKLVWSVAAAMIHASGEPMRGGVLGGSIAEAARRSLAAHDDQHRLEAVASRLARAIDARADELPLLLEDCFRDRQMTLAVALIAHGLTLSFEAVRGLFVDAADDRLWLALRALDLPRYGVARVAFLLSEADPRRDIDLIASTLEVVMTLDIAAARTAITSLGLESDYRAALLALRSWRP